MTTEFSRRRFFSLAAAALGSQLAPSLLRADSAESSPGSSGGSVTLAQAMYKGGQWMPRPSALRRLSWEIHKRTAANMGLEPAVVSLKPRELASSPFLYLAGDRPFTMPGQEPLDALARFIRYGGFLLIDTAHTTDGDSAGFIKSASEMVKALQLSSKPGLKLYPLDPGHVIYRSFYMIKRPEGRVRGPDHMQALMLEDRAAIVMTDHDLGGAWARDNFGNWEHEVVPGGDSQRESAFQLGINLLMYALCLDYKDDEPHLRFFKKRKP